GNATPKLVGEGGGRPSEVGEGLGTMGGGPPLPSRDGGPVGGGGAPPPAPGLGTPVSCGPRGLHWPVACSAQPAGAALGMPAAAYAVGNVETGSTIPTSREGSATGSAATPVGRGPSRSPPGASWVEDVTRGAGGPVGAPPPKCPA